jgi:DNA-binding NarL/FixJ family response regulator
MTYQLIRLLLIEDSDIDAIMVRRWLARIPDVSFEISHAECLAQGLLLLDQSRFDVIISDLHLPDSYGIETFYSVKSQAVGIPLILLTSLERDEIACQSRLAGATDYLIKGKVDARQFSQVILQALDQIPSPPVKLPE